MKGGKEKKKKHTTNRICKKGERGGWGGERERRERERERDPKNECV